MSDGFTIPCTVSALITEPVIPCAYCGRNVYRDGAYFKDGEKNVCAVCVVGLMDRVKSLEERLAALEGKQS